ncbi:MAG TPA: acyloxyacyl hydrolase [Allosphingosinicella sp.]|jgi:hypothetical protein|nr:acyloxyacyl hydrolase [Allosphingosinicella sp.]
MKAATALILCLSAAATPALAQERTGQRPGDRSEVFVGLYAHDVETPLNLRGFGEGVDVQLGWRGGRIRSLSAIGAPSPYVFGALNTAGDVHYAAAGVSWKFGRKVYVRPGLGLAIQSAPSFERNPERSLGSRIVFEPEVAVGVQVTERVSVEASLVHLSHATLFDRHNPGMDNVGVRLNYRF